MREVVGDLRLDALLPLQLKWNVTETDLGPHNTDEMSIPHVAMSEGPIQTIGPLHIDGLHIRVSIWAHIGVSEHKISRSST